MQEEEFWKSEPFLAYVNDGMRYGNFEFDLDDGEVVFKYSSIVPEVPIWITITSTTLYCSRWQCWTSMQTD